MKNLKEFDVSGKRVLVRCDLNVPLDGQGNILEDFRIQKSLPTIQYLIGKGAKIILMTHLGDPEGSIVPELKLDRIAQKLSELLGLEVIKANDCVGEEVREQVSHLEVGQVLLLENLRFHAGEKGNDPEFVKELSELGEIYINDAFSDSHRAHASIIGVPQHLPRGAGLLLEEEVKNLGKILKNPEKPMVVLVGGAKAATKAKFIENISEGADYVLVNGLVQKEILDERMRFTYPERILGPGQDLDGLDIDQETITFFTSKLSGAKTIVWNGPFGKFEEAEYKKGTLELAKAIIESGAFSVVGGGETIEFLRQEGMLDKFSHVSTGGGAMLDYLSGEMLPGLEALEV
ncbi:phosphoglycerate kinase [Candidatus Parcubacteria bacterium]|nr:phosphoglycerate kinase [Candidatus Parcubacteria bacterium]